MRQLVYLILILLPTFLAGQSTTKQDLTDIVQVAYVEGRLPIELMPKLDSLSKLQFPNLVVVIKADSKLGIDTQHDKEMSKSKVVIWAGEDIFMHNILYWMNPTGTSRRKNTAVIEYETRTGLGRRIGVAYKCFEGEIKAKFDGQKWNIVKAQTSEIECKFEHL